MNQLNYLHSIRQITGKLHYFLIGIGLIALLGWISGNPLLFKVSGNWASMKTTTAIGFTLLGVSFANKNATDWKRYIFYIAIGYLILIPSWVLGEYFTHNYPLPGQVDSIWLYRMSPGSAWLFIIAATLLLLDRVNFNKANAVVNILLLTGLILSLISLFGYFVDFRSLGLIEVYSTVSILTSIGFIAFFTFSSISPGWNVSELFYSRSSGGRMIRELIPLSVFLPFLCSVIALKGHQQGWYDWTGAFVLIISSFALIMSGVIYMNAWAIHKIYTEREELLAKTRLLNENLLQINEELQVTEEELRQNNDNLNNLLVELNHRNFELDQFVYKTSHDLRAPLTTIMGLTQLARHEHEAANSIMYFDMIDNRVRKLDEFIKQMLQYSRSLRLEIEPEAVYIEHLWEECKTELSHFTNSSRVQFSLRANIDCIYTDYHRLKVIFINLMSNTLKYCDARKEKSWLTVEVSSNGNGMIGLTFTDNGIGMEKEITSKIFNMFFRGHEHSEGSGLGMYIVKQAIEKLGGHINVRSVKGEGSAFLISLPDLRKRKQDTARLF